MGSRSSVLLAMKVNTVVRTRAFIVAGVDAAFFFIDIEKNREKKELSSKKILMLVAAYARRCFFLASVNLCPVMCCSQKINFFP